MIKFYSKSARIIALIGLLFFIPIWVSAIRVGTIPTVSTTAISTFDASSATLGGEVTADGGANVTERGIVYSTSTNPSTSDTKVQIGDGTGTFSQSMTGLTAATTYYVKAYAINSEGTSYGSEESFTTLETLTLTTQAVTYISTSSATVVGNIVSTGSANITERGIYYSTTSGFTAPADGIKLSETGDWSSKGTFGALMTGLENNTTYYVKAFAKNVSETSFGDEMSFSTSNINSLVGIDFDNGNSKPTNWNLIVNVGQSTSLINEYGALTVASIIVSPALKYTSTPVSTTVPNHDPVLNSIGGHFYSFSDIITTTVSGLKAGKRYNIWFMGIRSGYGMRQTVEITGATTSTFEQSSNTSLELLINDEIGSDAKNFSYYAKSIIADGNGEIKIDANGILYVSDNYTGIAGIAVQGDIDYSPLISTSDVTNITTTTATANGNITGLGNPVTTQYGVCWSTETAPSIDDVNDGKTEEGAASTTGVFASTIADLTPNTLYYVRAYATNSIGTSYGSEVSFTTAKTAQTITFPAIDSKTYGDASFTLGDATTDKGLTVTYTATDPTVVSITGNTAAILKAGSTKITATQAGNTTIGEATAVEQTLTVATIEITVTADAAQTKVYGANDPASYSYSVSPELETGDSFTGAIAREVGDTVGIYTYRVGTLSAGDNYTIIMDSVDFSITKKSITVTADASQTKVYGESDPTLTYSVSPALILGDAFTGVLSRSIGEDVDTYVITVGTLTAGDNYDMSFTSDNFSITKKAITVTADEAQTKVYGESDPTLTYSVSPGLISDDAFTGKLARAAGENVDSYAISVGTLSAGSNYDMSFTSDNFSITKKAITVTADEAQTKVYGESDPSTYTYKYSPELESGDAFTGKLARAAGENVDNYAISVGTLSAGSNYEISFTSDNFSITKKAITVTADASQTKVYGESDPTFTYGVSPSLFEGDSFTGALSRAAGEDVDSYAISLGSLSAGGNYDISFTSDNFSITKKAITVTADANQTKVLSEADPTLTYSVNPELVTGDSFSGTLSREVGETYGIYAINKGTLDAGSNYDMTYVGDNFEITKKLISIVVTELQSKTYGESDPTYTYTPSPSLEEGDSFIGALSREAGGNAGVYAITLGTLDAGDNYTLKIETQNFTITKKSVTVTADASQTKVYGESDPTFTYSVSPSLIEGDAFTGSLSRAAGEDVDSYRMTLGTLSAGDNYELGFESDNLTITKKAITVTADASQTKVYGESDATLTYGVSPALVSGDSFTGSLARATGENVDTYGITVGDLSAGSNYDMSYIGADFTITKKVITVTADASQTKVYGESDPSFTYGVEPALVSGDSFTGALARATGENADSYGITVGTLSAGDNYDMSYIGSDFIITKKAITVTADASQTKVYGESDPTFTYGVEPALMEGDSFTGTLARAIGENVDSYGIAAGTLSAGDNYDMSYIGSDFTITKKAITVTADASQTKVYGESDPIFAYGVEPALVSGDSFTGALTRATGETVDNYTISVGDLSAGDNYDMSYLGSDFTITKKSITVTADVSQAKVYGESDPILTYGVEPALVSGDSFTGTLTRAAGETVDTYGITVGDLSAGNNYDMSYVGADFTITKKAITVTADASQTKVYGQADPTFTYGVEPGLVSGDSFSGTLARATGENVDIYGITVGTLSAGDNYDMGYIGSDFTITTKQLEIALPATTANKVYDGNVVAEVTAGALTNLEAGDDVTVATTASYNNGNVGTNKTVTVSYALSGTSATNYIVPADDVVATGIVTAKPLTITSPVVQWVKMYDGLVTVDDVEVGDLVGVESADATNVSVTATATYDDATIAENKTITVVYAINGSAITNYIKPSDDYVLDGKILDVVKIANDVLTVNSKGGCQGENLFIAYDIKTGDPRAYKVVFDADAKAAGFADIDYIALPSYTGEDSIFIPVPEGMLEGDYSATVTFRNEIEVESDPFVFGFTINLANGYIVPKFDDLLICNNVTERFASYQWYKDGVAIDGATLQYYSDPEGLVGTYKVHVITNNGEALRTCEQTINTPLTRSASLSVYPNPPRNMEKVTVKMLDTSDDELLGATMVVYNATGALVYKTTDVHKENRIQLPVGEFIGKVTLTSGKDFTFKLTVVQ